MSLSVKRLSYYYLILMSLSVKRLSYYYCCVDSFVVLCPVPPEIYELKNLTKSENETAILICQSHGDPSPTMSFRKVGNHADYNATNVRNTSSFARDRIYTETICAPIRSFTVTIQVLCLLPDSSKQVEQCG